MISLLTPGLMNHVMWIGDWNEVKVGRHILVKNCMQHMTQYGECRNSNHAYTVATSIQMFIISVNYIQADHTKFLIAEMNEVYDMGLVEMLCNDLGLDPYPGRRSVQI
jgi:hypothetical protein